MVEAKKSPGTLSKSRQRIGQIFGSLAVPRFFYELFVLSVKLTFAMFAASVRLVVPPSKKRLIGETVLITGAGHGIGKELAIQLAAQGCIVVCWDIDVDANKSTMNTILNDGGEVYGFVVDVSKRFEVRETVRLMRKNGIPDVTILINNAAILMHQSFYEYESEDIERIFSTNVLSHFWTIEAFLPSMLQNDKGHIVAMCSMCGLYGIPQKIPYCASKFAVRGLMESLKEELRLCGQKTAVNFTTIYPFYIDTGLAKDPNYRFSYIFGILNTKYAAQETIRAIQRNYIECSIPRCLLYLDSVNRVLPDRAVRHILDYLARKN